MKRQGPASGRPEPANTSVSGRRWRFLVTLFFVVVCGLLACSSCPSESAQPQRPPAAGTQEEAIVFFTGNELGALKPCGCSGGQLGGLEKRSAVFDSAPTARRLIVDTGTLVESDREQDLIKFRILLEAFRQLEYDAVHLAATDLEIAQTLNLLAGPEASPTLIAAPSRRSDLTPSVRKRVEVNGRPLTFNVAAFDPETDQPGQLEALLARREDVAQVNIVILTGIDAAAGRALAARMPEMVDCVVCPSDSDEPQLLSSAGSRPLIFTVGRFGRYVCRLRVSVSAADGTPTLAFEKTAVGERLPDDLALARLYRQYQELVKASGLLENYARVPLPEGLAFVGSKACQRCHEYEYDKWSTKAHADAFATLEEVGSDYDPECVVCHVVGMEYESGFITKPTTPHLKDVGCENCHGPGSEHVRTDGVAVTTQPQMTCLSCHTPEHSGEYAGHEQEFLEKIVHWREP